MRIAIPLVSLAALVLCRGVAGVQASGPQDWPGFRGGPANRGVASQLTPPLHQIWMRDIGGSVESTAAIAGQTVYVATMKGKLFALRLADGKPLWTFSSLDSFSASPSVVNGSIYIGDEGGIFYCLDAATGRPRWKLQTGDKIISSAAPAGNLILFGSYDCCLYALNARTGKKRWVFRTDAQVHCSPCVAGRYAVIAGCDGKLRAIDIQTGRQRKAMEIGGNLAASPAYADGRIYFGAMRAVYLALNVATWRPVWKVQEREQGAACYASAAAPAGSAIFASRSARVFCVNAANGHLRWTFRTRSDADSSPVVAGSTVYVGSGEGTIYGVDLASGRKVWEFHAGQEVKASPAIANGRLVIGSSDGAVYCFGSR